MAEDKNHKEFLDLIPKYLSGEASDSEVKRLEQWVLSSPENKKRFNLFKKAWMLSGIEGNYQNIDVEKEWLATSEKLFSEAKVVPLKEKPNRRIGLFLRIAVAVALLIVASVWIYNSVNRIDYQEVVAEHEIKEDQLSDGTQIAVNQFSSVKYIESKDENVRKVELTGDAFFDVERDTARPFIISTQEVEIEVLGTSFYVDSRENLSEIQVIVKSGSVKVSAGNDQVVLAANEIGIFDKSTKQLTKKENDDVNYMAWRTNVLVFEETGLERVVFDLNRKFHSNISIADEALKTCTLTATYDDKSLEAIILIIEKTLDIKADIEGDNIIFSGQGCD